MVVELWLRLVRRCDQNVKKLSDLDWPDWTFVKDVPERCILTYTPWSANGMMNSDRDLCRTCSWHNVNAAFLGAICKTINQTNRKSQCRNYRLKEDSGIHDGERGRPCDEECVWRGGDLYPSTRGPFFDAFATFCALPKRSATGFAKFFVTWLFSSSTFTWRLVSVASTWVTVWFVWCNWIYP